MKAMAYTEGKSFKNFKVLLGVTSQVKFCSSCNPIGEGPIGLSLVYAQGVSLHKISFKFNEQDNIQPYKNRIVYIPRKILQLKILNQ
jgi:hypothetical protein